jgi:hypothetical protein
MTYHIQVKSYLPKQQTFNPGENLFKKAPTIISDCPLLLTYVQMHVYVCIYIMPTVYLYKSDQAVTFL